MANSRQNSWITGSITVNVLFSFLFGVLFLTIILGFSIFYPDPSSSQLQILLTVLALAAGGVGAILPGFLEIEHKSFFRAGGAIALSAMVYFNKPAVLSVTKGISNVIINPVEKIPQEVALSFLKDIDDRKPLDAWDKLDPEAVGRVIDNKDNFIKIFDTFRVPLGAVESREVTGLYPMPPIGFPEGQYRAIVFRTKFTNKVECNAEQVVLRTANGNLNWKTFSYTISPTNIPCR